MIIETSANQLYRVRETGDARLARANATVPKIVPSLFGRWSVLTKGETHTFERLKDAERFVKVL